MTRLAYLKTCDGCEQTIFMAICRDGRWRPFETELVEKADREVWAWRKRLGMEEQDIVRGHHIHYCADYFQHAFQDLGLPEDVTA